MRFYSYLLKLESLVFSGVGNSLDKKMKVKEGTFEGLFVNDNSYFMCFCIMLQQLGPNSAVHK